MIMNAGKHALLIAATVATVSATECQGDHVRTGREGRPINKGNIPPGNYLKNCDGCSMAFDQDGSPMEKLLHCTHCLDTTSGAYGETQLNLALCEKGGRELRVANHRVSGHI
jgi:hypothetical protein